MVQRFNVLTPHSPRPTATHCELIRVNSTFSSVANCPPRRRALNEGGWRRRVLLLDFLAPNLFAFLCDLCVSALNFRSYPKLFEPIRTYPDLQPIVPIFAQISVIRGLISLPDLTF